MNILKYCLPVLVGIAMLAGAGCSSDKNADEVGGVCEGNALANTTTASAWAQNISDIREYQHRAYLAVGESEIDLIGENEKRLGKMYVSQMFGHDAVKDGTMVAIMDGEERIRLLTRGYNVTDEGYEVYMELSRGQHSVEIQAIFRNERCYDETSDDAPQCAGALSLNHAGYLLPSCGLIADEYRKAGSSPVLMELRYLSDAEPSYTAPSVGGVKQTVRGKAWTLQVVENGSVADESQVDEWLAATGLTPLFEHADVRLLTTAYLDRAWWRSMEKHVSYCMSNPGDEALPEPRGDDKNAAEHARATGAHMAAASVGVRQQPACPGDTNASDWGAGGGSGARSWGDPHLTTFDGDGYDFMGSGEYLLFRAAGTPNIVVQARMEPLPRDNNIPACAHVSYATALATQIDGKRLTVSSNPNWEVRIDGQLIETPEDVPAITDGGSLQVESGRVEVVWSDGSSMNAKNAGKVITINATLSNAKSGIASGLFGNADGDPNNDRALPDGTPLQPPLNRHDLYQVYGDAWRINAADSLFDYPEGKSTADYTIAGFPSGTPRMRDLPEALRKTAERDCRDAGVEDALNLQNCILDSVCESSGTIGEPLRDASESPRAKTQTIGDGDVRLTGAIEDAGQPETVGTEDRGDVRECLRRLPKGLLLLKEKGGVSLSQDLDVDINAPGVYGESGDLTAAKIPAATAVQSYLIYQPDTSRAQGTYTAALSFLMPIRGVIIESVESTDAEMGAPQTSYQESSFADFVWNDDTRIAIDAGATSLEVRWPANATSRIRVITDALGE